MNDSYLAHHGIQGQKWGIRRFQNKDGTLTPEGKKAAKAERKIEKYASKVEKQMSKANKYLDKYDSKRNGLFKNEKKAAKYLMKADKASDKAYKIARKAEKLVKKYEKSDISFSDVQKSSMAQAGQTFVRAIDTNRVMTRLR